MNREMYFIPIIAHALEQEQVRHALDLAFEDIKMLGQRPECERSYAQFLRFMELVAACRDEEVCAAVRRCMIAWATDAREVAAGEWDAARDVLAARPGWQSEVDALYAEAQRSEWDARWPRLVLAKSGRVVRAIEISDQPGVESVGPIGPGAYVLELETGRGLWEATLRAADLIWSQSSRRGPLNLAADTPGAGVQPTREASLLGGEIILRVFAGVEAGRIEVEWRGVNGDVQ